MKILSLLLFIISANILYSQIDSSRTIIFNQETSELEFEVTLKESIPIGYAYCFSGTVIKVNKGDLSDKNVLFTVLPQDDGIYNYILSRKEDTVFKIGCNKNKENEEYSTTFITGFVDASMTSWKIVSISAKKVN